MSEGFYVSLTAETMSKISILLNTPLLLNEVKHPKLRGTTTF